VLRLSPSRLSGARRAGPRVAWVLVAALCVAPTVAARRRRLPRHAPAQAAAPAHPDVRGSVPRGVIRAVRRGLVYASLGTLDGASPHTHLRVAGAPDVSLEVLHAGPHQLVARVVSHGGAAALRPGARVRLVDPADASAPRQRHVVKELPKIHRVAPAEAARRWAVVRARGRALVPFEGARARPRPRRRVWGDMTLRYGGVLDTRPRPRDVHTLRLRSRLHARWGRWSWDHDVAGRLDLGPRLSTRPGNASRPHYELREAALGYESRDGDAQRAGAASVRPGHSPPVGSWGLRLGRLWTAAPTGTGLVDGIVGHVGLGAGLALGLRGGVVPDLLDAGFRADMVTGGGGLRGAWMADDWRASARLDADGSVWRGRSNRADVALRGTLAHDTDLYFAASATLTAVPGAKELGDGPGFALTHAYVGGSVRPIAWLAVDAHFAHDRELLDRELAERVGPLGIVATPRDTAWLRTRLDLGAQVSLWADGSYGFGSAEGARWGGAGRVVVRRLTPLDLRLAAGYRLSASRAVRSQVGTLELGADVGGGWAVDARYALADFHAQLLGDDQLEHSVEGRASWAPAGPWRLDLTAAWVGGDLPSHVRLFALLGWRFP